MKITIHRGTHQIGGCATEICTANTRIFVDFGSALDGSAGIQIDGLNTGKAACDGVLLTHYHGDHVGEINTILPGIPLYCGETAKLIMQKLNSRTKQIDGDVLLNMNTFAQGQSFQIGDIKITPYSVDHSAYDSYMFLIEAEGKRVLHTGDFRTHGFRGKGVPKVLEKLVGKVDVLICEGTTINGDHETALSEYELSLKIRDYIKEHKYVFAVCSSTNFDRLAAVCNAVPRGRYRVCDKYQLEMMEIMREHTKDYTELYQFERMLWYSSHLVPKMRDRGVCMFVRLGNSSHRKIMEKFADLQPRILYSMWKGYLDEPKNAAFVEGFPLDRLHTSGHADINAIRTAIEITQPEIVIPIHTESPDKFKNIAGSRTVLVCEDGENLIL